MWQMICAGDIRATFQVVQADEAEGRVSLVDEYTFNLSSPDPAKRRKVRNVIESSFRFRDGLVVEQVDSCDARTWAAMALGGVSGFLAGRIRLLRSWKAMKKLRDFVRNHPEYN
jgi:hypothetical protein